MERAVSAKEVAEFLGITEGTVYRLAREGKLPGVRIGTQWRFDLDRIKQLFNEGGHLGDMSGYDVLKEIKDKRYEAPTIVVTGSVDSRTIVDTIRIKKAEDEDRRANKELRKIDKVKSDFLSMVSHELRTPLASIKEGVALVLDQTAGPVNDNQKKFLEIAKRNIDRLAHLINDLLDLSKIESGKMQLMKGSVDLNKLAEDAKFTFENLANNKTIRLELDLEENLPSAFADQDKTAEIFANLVSNAIKYTNEGGHARLKTTRYSEDPNYLLVTIEDDGVGIAENDLPNLFQKFHQLEDTNTRKVGGTGLGLAICKQITELQGGRIWVDSKLGEGSRFSFTLPIEGGKIMKRRKILVIDDEEDLCVTIKARLESANMDVETALSGKEGIEKALSYQPEIILLDLMMPEMDGFEVCEQLKKDKDLMGIPVIVLTCLEDEESAKKAISKGANGYMVKPFDRDSLMFTVREFLGS